MSETIAPNGVDLTKLSLKDVKFHEDMSEETPCFTGLLVDDGVIVAYVKNDGHGGCNSYSPYSDKQSGIDLYERYGQLDVDCHITGLAEDWNITTLDQRNNFVLKKDNRYYTVSAQKGKSFAKLKGMKGYQDWVKRMVSSFEKQGYTVLNRNL